MLCRLSWRIVKSAASNHQRLLLCKTKNSPSLAMFYKYLYLHCWADLNLFFLHIHNCLPPVLLDMYLILYLTVKLYCVYCKCKVYCTCCTLKLTTNDSIRTDEMPWVMSIGITPASTLMLLVSDEIYTDPLNLQLQLHTFVDWSECVKTWNQRARQLSPWYSWFFVSK